MEHERFDRIVRAWSERRTRRGMLGAVAGLAIGAAVGENAADGQAVRGRGGWKVGHACDPARPNQCRSGRCGCNGTLCACRVKHCVHTGGSCRQTGNLGCCQGVCTASGLTCIV